MKELYIIKDYLDKLSKKRPGKIIEPVFIVAHDTGNLNSTARSNINWFKENQYNSYASAHIFTDHQEIRECIPALTGEPEQAYHVLYEKKLDNELFGDDANDVAIGVELCFFTDKERMSRSYDKYVCVLAALCQTYKIDPENNIIGHDVLDLTRKDDPTMGLSYAGKTFYHLIKDVLLAMREKITIRSN